MAKKYLEGVETVSRAFRHLERGSVEALTKALNRSGADIANTARAIAPEDGGALKRSIGHEIHAAPSLRGAGVQVTAYAGDSDAFYARWVEFGAPAHVVGGFLAGAQHPGVRPRPFFFPAYLSVRKRVRGRIRRAMRALGKEIARRNHGR